MSEANKTLVTRLKQLARGQYNGSHMGRTLLKAAGSLSKYPVPVTSGQQASQLQHIGSFVATAIDDILAAMAPAASVANAAPPPVVPRSPPVVPDPSSIDVGVDPAGKRRRKGPEQTRVLAEAFERDAETPAGDGLEALCVASGCSAAVVRRYFGDQRRKRKQEQEAQQPTATLNAAASEMLHPATVAAHATVLAAAGGGSGRAERGYVPKERTGNWAVLVALAEHTVPDGAPDLGGGLAAGRRSLLKAELVALAQPYCDAAFEPPPPDAGHGRSGSGWQHTAWSGVKRYLVDRALPLVLAKGSPRMYSLTPAGWALAASLPPGGQASVSATEQHPAASTASAAPASVAARGVLSSVAAAADNQRPTAATGAAADGGSLTAIVAAALVAGATLPAPPTAAAIAAGWELVLLLDTREVRSKRDRDYITKGLNRLGVSVEVRALPLGDVLWIARRAGADAEWVCPYIVERKTANDLRASISDARYKEQKLRLGQCGVPSVVYLVEGALSLAEYDRKLRSAMVSTQLHEGFRTKQTVDIADSVAFLAALTLHIECRLPAAPPDGRDDEAARFFCAGSYAEFGERSTKTGNLTVGELFAKQLVQIPRVSAVGAAAIHARWPTAAALLRAYRLPLPGEAADPAAAAADDSRRLLLAGVELGESGGAASKRKLGVEISATVATMYTAMEY
jgi:crossover junction endonuclease MUS81